MYTALKEIIYVKSPEYEMTKTFPLLEAFNWHCLQLVHFELLDVRKIELELEFVFWGKENNHKDSDQGTLMDPQSQAKNNTSPLKEAVTPSRVHVPKNFLLEEADFCRRRPGLQVVAYVHSAISRVHKRQETRSTWANATASGLGVHVAAVFMVGRAKDDRERQIVREESQRYHDIVQGDYDDAYRQLSFKALSSLSWISQHCHQVPWTLHADDDVFIDVFLMLEYLQEEKPEKFFCNTMWSQAIRTGKWAVTREEFPDDEYPIFCSGDVWVLPTRLLPRLLEASKSAPFLWVDDVYITGVLAQHAGITHLGIGSESRHIRASDVGLVMAWHDLEDDRRKWWTILTRVYRKALQLNQGHVSKKGNRDSMDS
ncbi:beta-1,3-galactosyltransferase 5-like [Penaeus japonicus]|uniref:beta-1,3-galactosyltransferase 5-like n=1 Tax=Penaeus japonicus TaxID=27405 RepID=UPI001C71554C|nr:beta-1,3-galactosyltransferase 5-like [Penaeus japonicus]